MPFTLIEKHSGGMTVTKSVYNYPDYLRHLYYLARSGEADAYRQENRIVQINLTDYDRRLFPEELGDKLRMYLVFREGKK